MPIATCVVPPAARTPPPRGDRAPRGRRPDAAVEQPLHDGRPDFPAQVVPGGADGHGNAEPAREPVRDVGDQRCERGGAADADQQVATANVMRLGSKADAMNESPSSSVEPATGRTTPKRSTSRPMRSRRRRSRPWQRVGQRRVGPRHLKLGLHRRQRHHDGPDTDAAEQSISSDAESHPGIGRSVSPVATLPKLCKDPPWGGDNPRLSPLGQAKRWDGEMVRW